MELTAASTSWEATIVELLNELSNVQDELLDVLSAKRDCMAAGDAGGMVALQTREQVLFDRLERCHQQRAAILKDATSQGYDVRSLEELAVSVDADREGKLRKQVKHAADRMRLLQHHSITNWVLAQRALLHLSQMLEIIATGGRLQPTYGKDRAMTARGALVDREA
jgi:flagellar biosynthesis/type III secretory pathway chaperone